jgi:AsmA protein
MKALKYTVYVLGALLLLIIIGVGIFAATFDPNKYKGELTRVVKEKKDRTLDIPGNIKLAIFPKLGVETGDATLSEYKSDKQFLKLSRARLSLDLLPLLRKELVIDKIEIEGLEANVVKGRDGKFNFDDLLTKEEKKDDQQMVKFDAQGFKIAGSALSYSDLATGQTARISDLNVETGRLANAVPSKFKVSANLEGTKPAMKARLDVAGEMTFDLVGKVYSVKGLDGKFAGTGMGLTNANVAIKGAVQADPGKKAIDASDLNLAFTGGYSQPGEGGKPGMEVSGADVKLTADALKLNTETLVVAATKINLAGNGLYNKEPFDIKVTAPTLAADGIKKAIRSEKIEVQAKGRQGQQAGTVSLDAAKVDADFSVHRIALESLNASGSGAMPGMLLNDFKAKVPKLQVDLGANQIVVDGVAVSANGKKGDDNFDLKIDAPRMSVSKDAATGEAVTGAVKTSGKDTLDMKFSLSEVKGSGKALTIGKVALDVAQAKFGETTINGAFLTALTANLEAKVFELAKIDANLTVANPEMPMKSVKLPITGSARADLGKETASADIATRFDESSITAKGGVAKFSAPAIYFDVNIDKLNVDKYFPPKPPAAKGNEPEKPIDLSALKSLNANGTVKIGALQVNNIKASNVVLTLKAAGGKVDLNPMSAALYQGTMNGSVEVDANKNAFVVKQNLAGVNINPLMKDAINKDILEGRGTINLDVTTTGNTPTALKKALNGSAAINLKDGAYKGVNLAKSFREIKAGVSLDKNKVQEAKKEDKTDFTEMKISAQIRNGVAESSDLDAKSPFLRLGGAGKVDIGASTMDYLAKATVVNTSGGQQGKELAQLNGLTVPVKVYGPLEAVKYDIQYGAVAASLISNQAKAKVEDQIKERLGIKKPDAGAPAQGGQPQQQQQQSQKPADKVKDKLKGLLGR